MAYFDLTKFTEVTVDASPHGVAAILTQRNSATHGSAKIVAYASRALTDTEMRYSQSGRH